MGKSTINGQFSIAMLVYQRVMEMIFRWFFEWFDEEGSSSVDIWSSQGFFVFPPTVGRLRLLKAAFVKSLASSWRYQIGSLDRKPRWNGCYTTIFHIFWCCIWKVDESSLPLLVNHHNSLIFRHTQISCLLGLHILCVYIYMHIPWYIPQGKNTCLIIKRLMINHLFIKTHLYNCMLI